MKYVHSRITTVVVAALLASTAVDAQHAPLSRPLSHLQHTHWSGKDGVPVSGVMRMERSPDGYLWLGSVDGLVRFDGVRFVTMGAEDSPALSRTPGARVYTDLDSTHAPAARVYTAGATHPLLVDRAGVLWISTPEGRLIRYAEGEFSIVLEPDSTVGRIIAAAEDGAGRLWMLGSIGSRLYRLGDGRLHAPSLPKGVPVHDLMDVIADTGAGLWIGTYRNGLWHVTGDSVRTYAAPNAPTYNGVRPRLQASDGSLWVLTRGVYRFHDGNWIPVVNPATRDGTLLGTDVTETPDGSVVIATRGNGIVRWKAGRTEQFAERDGLSSESAHRLLFDHEGSLWATTDAGLDRFRPAPFTTISTRNGLPLQAPASIGLDGDGSLWVMTSALASSIFKVDGERLLRSTRGDAVIDQVPRPDSGRFHIPFAPLPGTGVILSDNRGRLEQYRDGRLSPFAPAGLPTSRALHGVRGHDGSVWIAFASGDLGRVRGGAYVPVPLPDADGRTVTSMTEDSHGRIWVSLSGAPLVLVIDGDRIVRRLDSHSGLGESLDALAAGSGDTVWATGGSSRSLVRIADGVVSAFAMPEAERIFRGATPIVVPDRENIWLASSAGIARVSRAALDESIGPRDERAHAQLFTSLDGLTVGRIGRLTSGAALEDTAGRIWFSTVAGLAVIDRTAIPENRARGRVHIEEVLVDGKRVWRDGARRLRIPAGSNRLEIHYTLTSLLVPERVRIEYQLVGADEGWVSGSSPRIATYTALRPGDYDFRVRAWNEDGVPGANEATLWFTVLPAWYQTWWFAMLAVIAVAGAGSALVYGQQRIRARRLEERLHARFDATLEERARLARELHDTLLSGFTGITLQLQAVHRSVVKAPERAAESLSQVLVSADSTLREARQMIWDIRNAPPVDQPFALTLERAARDAAANTPIEVSVAVSGEPRPLSAPLETTLLRVGREAVMNAVKHAGARVVRVDLEYRATDVQLSVHDDGRGFDPAVAEGAIASGHWGISGMRERASRAGGVLHVTGRSGEGTAVSVSLPTGQDPYPTTPKSSRLATSKAE